MLKDGCGQEYGRRKANTYAKSVLGAVMLELALCSANSEHHKGMGGNSTLHPGLVGHRKGTKRVSGQGAAILSRELITGVEGNPCFVPWPLVPKALDLTNAVHTLSCIKFHAHFIT